MSTRKLMQLISWCFYGWGSHAYPVLVIYVFSVYFTNHMAENKIIGTYQWANAITIASLLIAILGPIFGSIADYYGKHKSWLFLFTLITVVSGFLLWGAYPDPRYAYFTLACIIVGTVAFEITNIFLNAYLVFLTPSDYIGRLSGWAWGLSYLGGIFALLIAFYALTQSDPSKLNSQVESIRLCGPIAAGWIALFTIPFFIFVPNTTSKNNSLPKAIKKGLFKLGSLFKAKDFKHDKNILLFLLSRMCYSDGLTTLFSFGGIYLVGTLGMSMQYILIFAIVTHITAGVGAILLAWTDDLFGSKAIILFSLITFFIGIVILIISNSITTFWVVTILCSIFIGPIQASSRSLMARIMPKDKITEMFGLYAFSTKATAFLGPWLFGLSTYYFNTQLAGMMIVLFFFAIGIMILWFVNEKPLKAKIMI